MATSHEYITGLLTRIEGEADLSEKRLNQLKREVALALKHKDVPTNIEILTHLDKDQLKKFKEKLFTKPVRTASGVSPVAIMTKPLACPHGKCTFCPGGPGSVYGDVPQSYTGHEPATMRAIRNLYDAYLQVMNRLEQYVILGQDASKVELIIMGGTFCSMPTDYQEEFSWDALQAMNDFSDLFFKDGEFDFPHFKDFYELPGEKDNQERKQRIQEKFLDIKKKNRATLLDEQRRNETAAIRCVAMCIETKPDWGKLPEGNQMLTLGCTRVELGLQSAYDDVLHATNRGHDTADSKESIRTLKDLGFKISAHWMPGLPNTDEQRDLEGFNQLWDDPDYRPDMLKIYPCMVAPGTPLYIQYQRGEFTPLSTHEAAERIVKMKKTIPPYCRVQRVNRDVPTKMWKDGVGITNLRQYMHDNFTIECRCIRCREPMVLRREPEQNPGTKRSGVSMGKRVDFANLTLNVLDYEASGGKEFFISIDDTKNNTLLGFCRLRFPSQSLRPETTNKSAIIRELHVYGTATAIGEEGDVQHRGLGKQLIAKAEEISKKAGKDKLLVISGIGAREYYYKLGYAKDGPYVSKKIK